MVTMILVGLAAVMATVAVLVTVISWFSMAVRIKDLDSRVKDYILVTPQRPGIQGSITARLFEAMKEVCETAKASMKANEAYSQARENKTALMSDVNDLLRAHLKDEETFKNAVQYLRKVESAHESEQK